MPSCKIVAGASVCYGVGWVEEDLLMTGTSTPAPAPKWVDVLTTKRVGEIHSDGSWIAELSRNGEPYLRIKVGSISRIIAQDP